MVFLWFSYCAQFGLSTYEASHPLSSGTCPEPRGRIRRIRDGRESKSRALDPKKNI